MNNPARNRPQGGMGRGPGGRMMFREKPKDTKNTLIRLIKYLGGYWRLLILLFVVMVFITFASLSSSIVQKYAIDAINPEYTEYDKISVTLFRIFYPDKVDSLIAGNARYEFFVLMLVILTSIYALSIVFSFFRSLITAYISQKTVYKMRKDLFSKIVKLPIKFFDNTPHGDIMSRMTNDVDSISNTVSQGIGSFISAILMVSGSFTVMVVFSPLLTLVSVVSIFLTIFVSTRMSKLMRKYFKKRQELLGKLNSLVEENVTGYRTVASYTKEEDICEVFNQTSNSLEKCGIKSQLYSGAMGPIMNILNNIGFLLMVVCGALFLILDVKFSAGLFGPLSVGTIILFTNCSKQFSRPINEIAQLFAQIETSLAAAERVFTIMDTDLEVDEGQIHLDDDYVINKIRFEHVYFSYVEGELVLKDFNLEVTSGQKIALVGSTGSGKTTVVNLLMRFYDVDSGAIYINDIDIRDIVKDDLRKAIAIVLQDTILFTESITKNVSYGNSEMPFDKIVQACELANADNFIESLPEKYDTILKLSGANLSQGERQLLSIARATAAEPKILILDEATSSVDTRTEKNIQNAMVALMKNRTSLIIAHRLSTIRDADKIIVMKDGRIIESGNHNELIKQKGTYYDLYQTQFAGNTI